MVKIGEGAGGLWDFGVCRPGTNVNDGEDFERKADTWLIRNNSNSWGLECNSCAGTGVTLDPKPKLHEGAWVGLLLDLDTGGTLTMYLEDTPCGTIAAGLAGPLLPCAVLYGKAMLVKIHGELAPPPQ